MDSGRDVLCAIERKVSNQRVAVDALTMGRHGKAGSDTRALSKGYCLFKWPLQSSPSDPAHTHKHAYTSLWSLGKFLLVLFNGTKV